MGINFKLFNLNKIIKEMYEKYYVPYCLNEADARFAPVKFNPTYAGGGKARTTTMKGKPIVPDEDDIDFVTSVWRQTKLSPSKALMIRYHLLSHSDEVLSNPDAPKDEKNKQIAKIEKGPEDSDGNISVKISFRGAGRTANIKTATIKTNIKRLREKVHKAGYTSEESLKSIFRRPVRTWERDVVVDSTAPPEAKSPFTIKPISFDYHARQEAENKAFGEKFQTEIEFRDKIIELATRAAESATGIKVHVKSGFDYVVKSTKGRRHPGWGASEFDEARQAAILHLSNETAHSPEKLDISDDDNLLWVKRKLQNGAQDHMRNTYASFGDRGAGRAFVGSHPEGDKGDSVDDTKTSVDSDEVNKRLAKTGYESTPEGDTDPFEKDFGNIDFLRDHLKMIKDKIKTYPVYPPHDESEGAKRRRRLVQIGMGLEDQIEKLEKSKPVSGEFGRMAGKISSPPMAGLPKPTDVSVKDKPGFSSAGWKHDDDDEASPEDLAKYRRRFMSSETFNFRDFLKLKEVAGASGPAIPGAIKKSPDFQWEGNPNSMIKPKKK